jgi:hypothetical protein
MQPERGYEPMNCIVNRPDFYPGKCSDSEDSDLGEWFRLQLRVAGALEGVGGTIFVVLVIMALAAFVLTQTHARLPQLP